MAAFAERTGLSSANEPRRYLWTDAFAVTNFLELYRHTSDERYSRFTEDLIGQVHSTLGRHRADDGRSGWLSGFDDQLAAAHPTAGGLRIGKPLPERKVGENYDDRLEWERDGQYFHYLTKWMEALVRAGSILHAGAYHDWAVELAKSTYPRFLQRSPRGVPLGLAWKMSIDLSRPLVSGMSPHDALDGYVTFRSIRRASGEGPSLGDEAEVLGGLVQDHDWATSDPLGLGSLLLDASRLAILPDRTGSDVRLIARILEGVVAGLNAFLRQDVLSHPPASRVAFRELGLAIGLQGLDQIAARADLSPDFARQVGLPLTRLRRSAVLGDQITRFWTERTNQTPASWLDHRDINEVMLARALLEAQARTAFSS